MSAQVLELLQSLRLHSTRSNRNLSTSDLSGLGRGRTQPAQPPPARIGRGGALGSSMDSMRMASGPSPLVQRRAGAPPASSAAAAASLLPAGGGSLFPAGGRGRDEQRLESIASSPPPGERSSADPDDPPLRRAPETAVKVRLN